MLEINRVLQCFKQLSGCRSEDLGDQVVIVMSAMKDIEASLDAGKMTEAAVPACEYAAACSALYDYVCRESSREQTAVTASGTADNSANFSHRIECAAKLKREALGRIEPFTVSGGFVFDTM